MGGWKKGAALAALVGILAGPAIAQTVGDGAKTQLTGTKIGGVNRTDTTGVVYGEGTVPGSMPVTDMAAGSTVLSQSNIINNYVAKTAPGVADSSAAIALDGAKNISVRVYTTANDSAAAIKYQILYLAVRYGGGTVADTTGAFPQLVARSPGNVAGVAADTVYAATASGALLGTREAVWSAQAGEMVIQCQTVATAGQRYFTVNLPPPAHGETYVSIRTRTGPVVYTSGPMNAASKWTMGTRVDIKGTK